MQLSDRIGRRIKLHDLHVLMAVVQAGSMNKAAALLNTTQPAVSKSIAELERTVGVRLLERDARGVAPTAYGRVLLDGGAMVFDELHQTMKNIEFLTDPEAGQVRFGCNPFLVASFASAVVDRFSQRYPRIVIHLVTGGNDALRRELSERNLDLVIARKFAPLPTSISTSNSSMTTYTSSWLARKIRGLGGVRSSLQSWSTNRGRCLRLKASPDPSQRKPFGALGLDYPRVTVVTISPEARISLLATGHFLSIFPTSALRFPAKRAEIKVLPIELPVARVPNGIVTLKNRTLSPVARRFIEYARDIAKAAANRRGTNLA